MNSWVDWVDRDSLLLGEDLGVAEGEPDWLSHWAANLETGVPRGPQPMSGVIRPCNRVKQGGPFKEAPRVLIGLVLKEIPCKNTPLKINFTST